MNVRLAQNAQEWNGFLSQQAGSAVRSLLLQSAEWLDFQEQYESLPVQRFFVEEDGVVQAAVGMSVRTLPFGKTVLFSASAPVLREGVDAAEVYAAIRNSDEVRELAKKHNAIFWRFAPVQQFETSWLAGSRRVEDIEPSLTTMIDLSQTEEDILATMKSKTRYNIRLAGRKGVEVKFVQGSDVDWKTHASQYFSLLQETNTRHGISAYPQAYYEQMFQVLGEQGVLELAVATHEDDVIAMNILLHFGETATYLHGASTHAKKNVMAPYALQWESIKRAKAAGYKWYDFYGVAPEGDAKHKLAGVTRFKRGFAGEDVEYAGMYEYPLSRMWYTVYRMINTLRK